MEIQSARLAGPKVLGALFLLMPICEARSANFGLIFDGANDYVTKPIDIDKLLSLLRIWLDRA